MSFIVSPPPLTKQITFLNEIVNEKQQNWKLEIVSLNNDKYWVFFTSFTSFMLLEIHYKHPGGEKNIVAINY